MFFIKTCLLFSTFLFTSGSLVGFEPRPRLDGRIVGGFLIDIRQVPWQATFELDGGGHVCGASIISDRWLLTASHCLDDISSVPIKFLKIRTGSSISGDGGELHNIKRIIPHERYNNKTIDYDFALIELVDTIEFNERAKAIALPSARDSLSDDTMCLVTGFGDTLTPDEPTENLRGVEVPIFNQEKCMKAYSRQHGITPSMLCAGFNEGVKDACQGDSGGPLAVVEMDGSAQLIGVVSWGYGCARPNYPGVYSRVTAIRDWIYETTGI